MIFLFGATLALSSALLFSIQPMFAKMVLPLFGGSPSVWNVCIFFYQFTLLMGYLYAYLLTTSGKIVRLIFFHLLLLVPALACLPVSLSEKFFSLLLFKPTLGLLGLLATAVGLPFLAVSASGVTIQKWFSYTDHAHTQDPYFLFRYSNLGSLVGLIAYPLWMERTLTLLSQSRMWAVGFGLLILLTVACAAFLIRNPSARKETSPESADKIPPRIRLKWVALAFVPSSLMVGVTNYLSSDISPFPLLWVVPLAIYLLSFVLTFSRAPFPLLPFMARAQAILILPLVLLMITQSTRPAALIILFHLLTFFVISTVFHGELAGSRPSARHLAEFYLWISVGGALAGLFNGILGPLVFSGIAEYPLTLFGAAGLAPARGGDRVSLLEKWDVKWPDVWMPLALGIFSAALYWFFRNSGLFSRGFSLKPLLTVPAALCFLFSNRPPRFGLGLGALMCAGLIYAGETGLTVMAHRSFFGVHKVILDPENKFHWLVHGVTVHGGQSLDESRAKEPLAYYHRQGPWGQIFTAWKDKNKIAGSQVAVVGLGAGSMAAYVPAGSFWTFYEIDPAVAEIAKDRKYFSFLEQCAGKYRIVIGDARLTLNRAPDRSYSLLVLDAFGSSAVPVHLLTREAFRLYLSKLAAGGVLAFHITSRHLQLEKVVADLAEHAGLFALDQEDLSSDEETKNGKFTSRWVVLAQKSSDLGALVRDARWRRLAGRAEKKVWSDNFFDVLEIVSWD